MQPLFFDESTFTGLSAGEDPMGRPKFDLLTAAQNNRPSIFLARWDPEDLPWLTQVLQCGHHEVVANAGLAIGRIDAEAAAGWFAERLLALPDEERVRLYAVWWRQHGNEATVAEADGKADAAWSVVDKVAAADGIATLSAIMKAFGPNQPAAGWRLAEQLGLLRDADWDRPETLHWLHLVAGSEVPAASDAVRRWALESGTATRLAAGGLTSSKVACLLARTNPDLVEPFVRRWIGNPTSGEAFRQAADAVLFLAGIATDTGLVRTPDMERLFRWKRPRGKLTPPGVVRICEDLDYKGQNGFEWGLDSLEADEAADGPEALRRIGLPKLADHLQRVLDVADSLPGLEPADLVSLEEDSPAYAELQRLAEEQSRLMDEDGGVAMTHRYYVYAARHAEWFGGVTPAWLSGIQWD